jgi:hypothetical protein
MPLRLSFDVNQTILMLESVKQQDLEATIADAIAKKALGVVDPETGKWIWDGVLPLHDDRANGGLVSYNDWLMEKSGFDKKTRSTKRTTCVQKGEPGEKLAELSQQLVRILKVPPEYLETCVLLPSFLQFVRKLKESGATFSVSFRSFGEDLLSIVEDWNRFCRGEHPLHKGFMLPGLEIDQSIDAGEKSIGYLWRGGRSAAGTEEERVALVLGTTKLAEGTDTNGWGKTTAEDALDWYKESYSVIDGLGNVKAFMDKKAAEGKTIAIRDCYPHWAANQKKAAAGKLHLIDTGNPPSYYTLFFDDNVYPDPAENILGVVDCRGIDDFTRNIPPSEVFGKYAFHVDTLKAVIDNDFFMTSFMEAHNRVIPQKISQREAIIRALEAKGVSVETNFDYAQFASILNSIGTFSEDEIQKMYVSLSRVNLGDFLNYTFRPA